MADRDAIRRALAPLEGPLRFARTETGLQRLKGLDALVGRAVGELRRLPLTDAQTRQLTRLIAQIQGFDALDLGAKRRALEAVAIEAGRLTGDLPDAAPPEPDTSRLRVKPLSADQSHAPVSTEGELLQRPLSTLKGVGPAVAQKLAARGLHTLGDALLFLPRRYEDRRTMSSIAELRAGTQALVRARVTSFTERFARKRMYELIVDDGSDTLVARWFGFKPAQFRAFVPGAPVVLSGEVRDGFRGRKEIIHPDLEVGEEWDDPASFGRIIPVYTEIEGISARFYRRIAQKVVEACAARIDDFHDDGFRKTHGLVPLREALAWVHFPPHDADFAELQRFAAPPQRRLVFDELFFVQLGLALRKRGVELESGTPLQVTPEIVARAMKRLPFEMTGAQRRAFDEVARDVSRPTPMNRLLQGDVGSGKTAVALASALVAVENGFQAAVMAPTELLAEQHFATFEKLLGGGLFARRDTGLPPVRVALLSGGRPAKETKRTLEEVRSGTARIVVGTHALLSEGVEYQKLGLVVVDEQHRFGVLQRARLQEKGQRPHVLVMTATPIPRTLALTLYGDLDVSVIDELPPGRTPIVTKAFSSKTRQKAYDLIRHEVAEGRQAYVVLPLVEESEKLDLRSAVEEFERLQQEEFRSVRLGLVHGRMSPEERSKAMDAFRRAETQILVATTVIEVGVDVPNASVMLIEHAERFGLSQLHQLRGRVGRGAAKSYCLLLHEEDKASAVARQRIAAMVKTNDGFKLSETDLEIRGPGEFLGTRQSGMPDLVVADLLRDQEILKEAREAAFAIVKTDPDLRAAGHRGVTGELLRRWAGKLSLARIG